MKKFTSKLLLATTIFSLSSAFAANDPTSTPVTAATDTTNIATENQVLQVSNATLIINPNGKNAAAYLTVTNPDSKNSIAITGVSVAKDVASRAEMHQTITNPQGVSEMISVDVISIPASGTFEFKRGADHIMFFELQKELKAHKDKVTITLSFDNGKSQDVVLDLASPVDAK